MRAAHAFANFYVIRTRGEAEHRRRVNVMKGRPPSQVGSITGAPAALTEVCRDFEKLPGGSAAVRSGAYSMLSSR